MHPFQFSYKQSSKKRKPIDDTTFIILASAPVPGNKRAGPVPLIKWEDSPIIDYQLQSIFSVSENPEIIVVCGYESGKLYRRKLPGIRYVENQLFEMTNDAEDFRLGLNNITTEKCCVIDGGTIPTAKTLSYLIGRKTSCALYYHEETDENIGMNIDDDSMISDFKYSARKKHTGVTILSQDSIRACRYIMYKNDYKKLFMFEILQKSIETGINIRGIIESEPCFKMDLKEL